MNIGMSLFFQGQDGRSDNEIYRNEIKLGDLAEPLGFQAMWGVEHHFDDYTMCPDVTQFLTFYASRTSTIQLGSEVVVLPWHNPVRVAEEVAMLDQLSNGRFIFGMGRGVAADRVRRAGGSAGAEPRPVHRIGADDPARAGNRRGGIRRPLHQTEAAAHQA